MLPFEEYKMPALRKYSILLIDLLFIALVVKAMLFDPPSDTNGAFSLLMIVLCVGYTIYGIFLCIIFPENKERRIYIEALFLAVLLLPLITIVVMALM